MIRSIARGNINSEQLDQYFDHSDTDCWQKEVKFTLDNYDNEEGDMGQTSNIRYIFLFS